MTLAWNVLDSASGQAGRSAHRRAVGNDREQGSGRLPPTVRAMQEHPSDAHRLVVRDELAPAAEHGRYVGFRDAGGPGDLDRRIEVLCGC